MCVSLFVRSLWVVQQGMVFLTFGGAVVRSVCVMVCTCFCFFFFFQAEDGIRDKLVTGVQTCALPISSYLMSLDERIAVAAPSCYITSLERLFATIGPQDAEQNITGQVAFGMDHGDYAILRAPKPTLFSVGTQDFFDISGSWDTFREVKLVYGRLGFGERVDLFESDEPHGFTRPRREAATRWLRRWLLKIDDAPVEPDFPIATDAQLQCTKTGQVLSDFHGKSVFDL